MKKIYKITQDTENVNRKTYWFGFINSKVWGSDVTLGKLIVRELGEARGTRKVSTEDIYKISSWSTYG